MNIQRNRREERACTFKQAITGQEREIFQMSGVTESTGMQFTLRRLSQQKLIEFQILGKLVIKIQIQVLL